MNILLNLLIFALNYNEKKCNNVDMAIDLNKIKKIPDYISIIKNKSGYDFRNNTNDEINMDVLKSIKKHEILMILQSPDISIFEKMTIIEEIDVADSYLYNISKGGLFDDWNEPFEFSPFFDI
jgi:hypothetical protein